MEIVEAASCSRTGNEADNEDAFVITDQYVAVIDGTSSTEALGSDLSPGRIAAQALVEVVRDLRGSSDPQDIMQQMHAAIGDVSGGDESVAAACAVLDVESRRMMRVGDIRIGVGGVFDNPLTLWEDDAALARAALLRCHLARGDGVDGLRDNDLGRSMILPLIRQAVHLRNRDDVPYGFGAIDGTRTPPEMVGVFRVASDMEVVLATDGYPTPMPTLADSEERLRATIESDPLRIGPPGGLAGVPLGHASFEDRTYVRVRF